MKKILLVAPLLFLAPLLSVAQQTEKVDLNTIHRIKEEALGRNTKVMDTVFYLTDVNGPRCNNSKGYQAAADWAVKRLKEYGLSNVHLEKWAPFGKGWNLEFYSGHMLEPKYQPIIAMPVAWTAGTDGVVSGNPILVTPQTQAELDAFKGKLAGKIVMISPKRDWRCPPRRWASAIPTRSCRRSRRRRSRFRGCSDAADAAGLRECRVDAAGLPAG